jgi:BON domain
VKGAEIMGNYYETFDPPFFMERRYEFNAVAVNSKGYDRDDAEIVSDLLKRLAQLGPIDTNQVHVSSEAQVIVLTGTVVNQNIKRFLGLVADNVLGVRSVHNQLTIPRFGASSNVPKLLEKLPESEAFSKLDELIPTTEPTDIDGNNMADRSAEGDPKVSRLT